MGGNFAQAGSQLAGGFTGAAPAAGSMQGAAAMANSVAGANAVSASQGAAAMHAGYAGVAPTAASTAANLAPAAAKAGMWETMLTSPHTMPAVINAGGTMLSSLGNAKAQEEMWNRQQQMTDEERARYSRNIGSTVNFQPRRG